MAFYLKDLAANPALLEELRAKVACCIECGAPLQETITGKRHTDKGDACSDCFYGLLGDLVEQHPIAAAGVRRG